MAPFMLIGVLGALMTVVSRVPRAGRAVLAILAIGCLVDIQRSISEQLLVRSLILGHQMRGEPSAEQVTAVVARELRARGFEAGDRVATINSLWNVDWAQRARLHVRAYAPEYTVSVVHTVAALYDACARARWATSLAARGIAAVVLRQPTGLRVPAGFSPLGDTGYWVMSLRELTPESACVSRGGG